MDISVDILDKNINKIKIYKKKNIKKNFIKI